MTAVLVVDDSLTVRMDLVEALEEAGFRPVPCATAREARAALEQGPIDLVILDVLLPDGDGVELLEELRARPATRTTPVLMLSTEIEVKHRVRGLRTGADDYVGKPYDTAYVIARVRELTGSPRGAGGAPDTVLLVDDSTTFREALRSALEDAGYGVVTASDGEAGLRVAAARRPDAIVVDGVMPGIDGVTFVRRVRLDAALRRTPCVLLTASEDHGAEPRALEAGADAFVRKDEEIDVILARLAATLRAARSGGEIESRADPKRILAVDDSMTYLNELSSQLRDEGYEVIAARSGEEALDMLAVQGVDCILLDLLMPGLGGKETCRRIKASSAVRDIPLLMLTAVEDRAAVIDGLGTGADDYISKSSDFDVLRARVQAQIRRKQSQDENRRIREKLLRSEVEAADARTAREVAEARVALIDELEEKNEALEAAYRELQQTQAQLVHSAKMASLGELVAGVAHEINSPLAFAMGHLQTVQRSLGHVGAQVKEVTVGDAVPHWERALNRLGEMHVGLDRIRELIVRLRTFSRLDEGERKVISVRESVESTLMILGHRIKGRIEVVTRFGDVDMLDCYAGLLNQVLLNLLSNSLDAMGESGTLTLSTGTEGDWYVITVADTGSGISPSVHPRIFEPFFTTKPVGQGTGLGLSITYSIVRKHGGEIELSPLPGSGKGTIATVRLPLTVERR